MVSLGIAELLIILAIYVAIIWACTRVARMKGRSPVAWGVLAAVMGVIPLIVVALLPRVDHQ